MGFGSIQGIPPLPPVVGPRAPSVVHGVFAAEFSRQEGGGAEPREESRRGLEAEEEPEELDISPDPELKSRVSIVI